MKQDIVKVLLGWSYRPDSVQTRMVEGSDGRQVIQMRLDLGLLQMEKLGRPDGTTPHGYPTYLEFLKSHARQCELTGRKFQFTLEHATECDRELVQFYHRRICWLALENYTRAIADANHTLSLMEFIRDNCDDDDYVQSREQYRGFVLFHRTQAAASLQIEREDPEGAIDAIRKGIEAIEELTGPIDFEEEDGTSAPMTVHLQRMELSIREKHNIGETLKEQLAKAVENEQYEKAAELRDALRRRA